jgi:Mn2+/Fe2+ NRAMP family transporter
MSEPTIDPYTVREGEEIPPPTNFWSRIKYLGPSVLVAGSIVGSGELILTASLGAAAGFGVLWWMLISCWSKSLVQAEITRYIVISGDTYLRALNRIPGKLSIFGLTKPIAWPLWIGLVAYIPATMSMGGIIGGAGQALTLLGEQAGFVTDTEMATRWTSGFIALVAIIILNVGSYKWLEKIMLFLVMGFTFATLVCAIAMQFTEYRIQPVELLSFESPLPYAAIAFAAYGYTGVNAGEISAYTYWCIEKGYPSFIGPDRESEGWVDKARGWMKVLHTDVWLTLAILTCATLPYFVLGAGVLNKMGERPEGNETINVLSNMFTQTLGPWAVWMFATGAFFILFSTVLSGIGGGGRFIPDYLIEMGFFERSNLAARQLCIRVYVTLIPIIGFLIYIKFANPLLLVIIGGLLTALTTPIQTGATIWLQATKMNQEILPGKTARIALKAIFAFQILMAFMVMWFVVIKPRLG